MSGTTMKSVVTRSGFSCGVGRHLPRSVHLTCNVKRRARLAAPSANLAMAAPAAAASVAWTTGLSENGAAMGALSAALPTALAAVLAFGLARFMQVFSSKAVLCLLVPATPSESLQCISGRAPFDISSRTTRAGSFPAPLSIRLLLSMITLSIRLQLSLTTNTFNSSVVCHATHVTCHHSSIHNARVALAPGALLFLKVASSGDATAGVELIA